LANTAILGINDQVDGSCFLTTDAAFGLTGFNTGNLAFHYAMNHILGGNQTFFPWGEPTDRLNDLGKTLVFPCANNLGPHANFGGLAKHFSNLQVPIVAVGMGAQGAPSYEGIPEVPEGTQNWVREISARSPSGAPNIGVRGPYTLEVLKHYGLADRAVVTGCPTLFINPAPKLGQVIASRAEKPWKRIAIAGGHQGWRHLSKIEASLSKIMEASGGSYIVQSPVEMLALARGEADLLSVEALTSCRDYVYEGMDLEEFKAWSRHYFRVFFNVSEWMECLRGHDFVVGARIHGVMLGLQAGIPGLCIAHDSRTRELCETLLVPYVMAKDISRGTTPDDLRARFEFDGEKFDENRRTLAGRFDEFLTNNMIESSSILQKIMSA